MNENASPAIFSPTFLRESVLIAVLAGNSSLSSVLSALELPRDTDVEKSVKQLLSDPAFLREVEHARQRTEEWIVKKFKQHGMQYAKRMDELTKNSDPRVAFQATKDLLDRIGTAPQQRVAVSGMGQYQALLKELEPDAEKPDEHEKPS